MGESKKPKSNFFKLFIFSTVSLLVIIFIFSLSYTIESKTQDLPKAKIISGNFDKSKIKSDEEWKKILTTEQFHILREKETDIPLQKALRQS